MTDALRDAATSLQERLSPFPWFRMVGVSAVDGMETLVVYVTRKTRSPSVPTRIPTEWEGFRVKVQEMSRPSPAHIRDAPQSMVD